jgi:spore coat polysaccharide biosynthesis protein SpsF
VNKIAIIIFARLNSKRLKGKVLKKIFDKYLLEIIYLRLKRKLNFPIIVNTSKNKSDDKIIKFCQKRKIKFFRGSLNNVFSRTVMCLKKEKIKGFIRVNADRPFIDASEIKKAVKIFQTKKFDIVTNQIHKKIPKGLSCEIASSNIFYDIFKKKKLTNPQKEHIFNYFYSNKAGYKIHKLKNSLYEKNAKFNLSVDNKKDFKRTINIFLKYKNNIFISTSKILKDLNNK